MNHPYGPWATLITAGQNPQLSTFWRRRMGMLASVYQTSPSLSRRSIGLLIAAAAFLFLLPTFRAGPAIAQQQPPATENGKGIHIESKEALDGATTPAEKLQTVESGKAATITEGTERSLRWGEPAKGLRAAIAIRRAPDKPKRSDFPNELYLVVQNVSGAPIRVSDTTAAPKLRELYLKNDGRILVGYVSKDPTGTDVVLRPREVAFLLTFAPDTKNSDRPSAGAIQAEDALQDTHRTLVAEMHIDKAPAGAWTGKLRTGETNGEAAACKPLPKGKEARALFNYWQANARTDGKIPGALIGRLGDKVNYFISLNKGDNENNRKLAEQFEKLLPRFDASHDWTQSDAIALLDDITAICTVPLETTTETAGHNTIQIGKPLPAELADAPWGWPSPDGLRVAWLVAPRAKEYPLGTSLKSRILVHNFGKKSAIFIIPSWQQSVGHTAHNAKGAVIEVPSPASWTTMGHKMIYRLAPGEYCEALDVGIGVGAQNEVKDWPNAGAGSFIHAKPGDDVRLSPGAVEVTVSGLGIEVMNGRPLNPIPKDAADMWEKIIAERVGRELPLPAAAAERTQIIRRVMRDLFGDSPTPDEVAAFVADKASTAEAALVNRLLHRPGIAPFMGMLTPGDIRFRVLPAETDAAKKQSKGALK